MTPMIDVVFLLLVFFMLASRFGVEQVIPLPMAGQGGAGYAGPPRIVDIAPDAVRLNGAETPQANLADAIAPLTARRTDTIVLRGQSGADVQRIVDVAEALAMAGFTALVLVE